MTIRSEDDYCSHLIGAHSDTPWLPCVVTAEQKCKQSFANKELQSLHHLLYHKYSSETLKHLSLVKCDTSKIKPANSFIGSKEDFAIIRLIVRLYTYLRNFKIPSFDPYLASITLFNNATATTCSDLDKILIGLSLCELETKATVTDDLQQTQGVKEKNIIRDTCYQSPSLVTNIPSMVLLQAENQPQSEAHAPSSKACSIPSSAPTDVGIQQNDVTTAATSTQRPLLSMPLLTDLQPTSNVEQLPHDTIENNDAEITSNSLMQSTGDTEIMSMPELASTNVQEPYNSLMLLDGNVTNSSALCGDNISDVFDTSALSSSAGNVTSGNLDLDNAVLLSDDILDLANDPACVRDLMESVELSYLLPPDFLESSSTDWVNLTMLDNDGTACPSNEATSDIPNFAHLSNPLADLTFESLSAIPDSILESTLQMMIENSHSSSDILMQSTSTAMDTVTSVTSNSSTAKGKSSYNVNKRSTNAASTANQKRKKAIQLARV